MQKSDGGWGWWQEGDLEPYLTALAIDAIARAVLAGAAPDGIDQALDRVVYLMPRIFGEARTHDGEAYLIAHLASLTRLPNAKTRFAGVPERIDELMLAVRSASDQLSNAGLALAAQAHAELGLKTEAGQLLDKLMARAVRDGGLHWDADPAAEAAWWGEDASNTGYALSAMIAVRPEDKRTSEVVEWLARHRRGPWWNSTRVSAPAAIGLCDYVAAHAAELKAQGTIRVDWNGARVLDATVGAAEMFGANPLRAVVESTKLKPGDNRLAIAATGGVSAYWSWSARALVPSPGPALKPAGLVVTREFLRAERTTDRRGRPRYLTTALAAGEPVRVGEAVLVRLTLRADKALRYVMVEDPRLAGFEIDQLLPDGAEWPYATHAEARDDRAVFFLENVDSGETTLEYLLRPEIPGRFTALPATASGMYDPDLIARSADAVIAVEEKK
jgi:uncharacterized protein YfaS (alpha-2-macroglobulin family)